MSGMVFLPTPFGRRMGGYRNAARRERAHPGGHAALSAATSTTKGLVSAMTAQPPDPDPGQTPGLEGGGGVAPGTTPPAAPQTSGVAQPQPPGRGRLSPTAVVTIIATCIFVVVFVAVGVLLVMKMVGATG